MCNSYTLLDLLLSYIENLFLVNGEWEMEGDMLGLYGRLICSN